VALVLASLVVGCQERPVVKVSGAVQRPGDYAYQREWLPVDYVTAAGETLSEAHVSKAYLRRAKEDTAGFKTIVYGDVQRWPLDRAPFPMPGARDPTAARR
jgi:hypothetical protein